MPTKQRNFRNKRVVQLLWLLGGGLVIVLITSFGYMYLRVIFRQKPEYTIENSPGLENPRFPLLVVSLSNSLTTSVGLSQKQIQKSFYSGDLFCLKTDVCGMRSHSY